MNIAQGHRLDDSQKNFQNYYILPVDSFISFLN